MDALNAVTAELDRLAALARARDPYRAALTIARAFSAASSYAVEATPYASGFAGYKDWFIQNYDRPGYTIEAGLGDNPLPISEFDRLYGENLGILTLGLTAAQTT